MAPSIAISSYDPNNEENAMKLKKRNEELEKELNESLRREEMMRAELERAWARVRVAEDAEERLCSQLADLEVEAVEQARDFHARLSSLMEQLARAQLLLHSTSIS